MGLAAGTVSLLGLNNNLTDDGGGGTWSTNGTVTFDATNKAEGTHSAAFSGLMSCIHSDLALSGTIITIEFHLRPTASGNKIIYTNPDSTAIIQSLSDGRIRFWASGFSGLFTMTLDTFAHVAMIYNDGSGGSELFVDNVSRITKANTVAITNVINHIGDRFHPGGTGTWNMDFVRLSDILQPGPYPTVDPPSGGFMTPNSDIW